MKRLVAVLSLALALNVTIPQFALAADEYWVAWGYAWREKPAAALILTVTPVFVVATTWWSVRSLYRLNHRWRTGEEMQ